MVRRRRGAGSAIRTPEAPKSRQEVVDQLADSEVNRRIEIEFSNDVLNFSSSTRYPATIRDINEGEFNIVLPTDGEFEEPPEDNALKGEHLTLFSLDHSFADAMEQVVSYYYEPEVGHIFGFANQIMQFREREFLRVPYDDRVNLLIIGVTQESAMPMAKGFA